MATFIHTKPRYSVPEAAELLNISSAMLRARIAAGTIESHLDGDRRFVSARAIDAYIERAESASRRPVHAGAARPRANAGGAA